MGFRFDQGDRVGRTGADKGSDTGSRLPVIDIGFGSDRRRFQYIFVPEECGLDLPEFNTEAAAFYLPVVPPQKKVFAVERNDTRSPVR